MSLLNLLHTIPEFREMDYQLRSYGFDLNSVLSSLDLTTVSIAALVVALGVIAYSFLAKGPSGLIVGKSLDNSLDGGKAWHDTQEFGFRSLSDNSTDVSHAQVLKALSDIMQKWDSEDGGSHSEDEEEEEVEVTVAPQLDTDNDITARRSRLLWR